MTGEIVVPLLRRSSSDQHENVLVSEAFCGGYGELFTRQLVNWGDIARPISTLFDDATISLSRRHYPSDLADVFVQK